MRCDSTVATTAPNCFTVHSLAFFSDWVILGGLEIATSHRYHRNWPCCPPRVEPQSCLVLSWSSIAVRCNNRRQTIWYWSSLYLSFSLLVTCIPLLITFFHSAKTESWALCVEICWFGSLCLFCFFVICAPTVVWYCPSCFWLFVKGSWSMGIAFFISVCSDLLKALLPDWALSWINLNSMSDRYLGRR